MDNLIINIASIGTLLLIIYIIIDCIRHKTANFLRRLMYYSFVFYLLFVFEYTTGCILIPLNQQLSGTARIQLLPFQFVLDWIDRYQHKD